MKQCLVPILMLFSAFTWAQSATLQPPVLVEGADFGRYIARLEAHSKSEIESIFERADVVMGKVLKGEKVTPIQFVLHGDEARLFFRQHYDEHKELINRAARLDAFNVIDIKVCETWMRIQGESLEQLYPFIETVPLGPAEEKRLMNQGYIYF